MKKPKIKALRLLAFLALCCAIMVGSNLISSSVAEAATKKASISATKMTIPIGKIDSKIYWNTNIYLVENMQKLSVKDKLKGATYKFTSSDTKVVKISADGSSLTGLKAGSATITCTQTYQKKSTVVGKCKVTVKAASLEINSNTSDIQYPIGTFEYDLLSYYACADPLFNIVYRNPDAKYTFTSSSKDLTVKEIKYDASKVKDLDVEAAFQEEIKSYIGSSYIYGYQFTAKAAGTYKVTVKETYNKKTKTLGTLTIVVNDTSIAQSEMDLLLGKYYVVFDLLSYPRNDINYYFEIKDYDTVNTENNVLDLYEDGGSLYLYAKNPGTTEVNIYENSEGGTLVGTVTVNVKELPVESISLYSNELTTYVGDENFYID
ncbi:MAG TPA: Ig-like domain-containing protein, partial [Mobilitalea sp.]|nr:Ig-like domain-containing protein [Mobilitalea sp.]